MEMISGNAGDKTCAIEGASKHPCLLGRLAYESCPVLALCLPYSFIVPGSSYVMAWRAA